MRFLKSLQGLFGCFVLFTSCGAVSTVGTDTMRTFGGSTTSTTIIAQQTPSPGNVMIVAGVFGVSNPAPSLSGFTSACANSGSSSAYVFYRVVQAGDSNNYGSMTFSAASGTVLIAERSGMNTTTPIDVASVCPMATPAGTVTTPTLALPAPAYQNEVAEALFETASLTSCGTGVGTCQQSGWTERGYRASTVFGEEQFRNTTAPQVGVSALLNFTTTSGSITRITGWYDVPATVTPWVTPTPSTSCNGSMMLGMVGC